IWKPTWKEGVELLDERFKQLVSYAKEIIKREIKIVSDSLEAEDLVLKAYNDSKDKRLVITESRFPWEEVLSKFPEPIFVIYQIHSDDSWSIKTIRDDMFSYDPRKKLPASWAGKTGKELE